MASPSLELLRELRELSDQNLHFGQFSATPHRLSMVVEWLLVGSFEHTESISDILAYQRLQDPPIDLIQIYKEAVGSQLPNT